MHPRAGAQSAGDSAGPSNFRGESRIFEVNKERTQGPAVASETMFEYLQRSADSGAIRRCEWFDLWFADLPYSARESTGPRLRASRPEAFYGALFELVVHRMLRRLNLIVEPEPSVSGAGRRIDFVAHLRSPVSPPPSFYVEATVAGVGRVVREGGSRAETDTVEKLRRAIPEPHSDIWLQAEGRLDKTLGLSEVAAPFRELLACHSAADVAARWPTAAARYARHWEVPSRELHVPAAGTAGQGWMLRGELGRPISSSEKGCIHGPSRALVGGEGIRLVSRALAKKAEDWRHVDFDGRPFFVAINACHSDFWNADDRAAERALFGESGEPTVDGRFAGHLEHLNGVVPVNNGVLGNEDNALVRVFRNGTKPLPECLRPLLAGMPMGELLGIHCLTGSAAGVCDQGMSTDIPPRDDGRRAR